ncbi:MAG TPA: hypothetical protein VF919_16465 [Gemmatimonadales bacterium]
MTDFDRLDRLRGYFHTGETPIAKPDCLDEHTVAALADGALDAERRGRALAHVATCAHCRRAVASVAAALADGPITHEIEVVEGRRRRRGPLLRIAVPLAAAATVLLFLWSPRNEGAPGHRGPPAPPPATTPVPRSPVGVVALVNDLRWSHVAGADRYRVTVFDATGGVVYTAEASDTVVAFPDSVPLVPGAAYLWKVDARTGFDRWAASVLAEFRVAPESRRR